MAIAPLLFRTLLLDWNPLLNQLSGLNLARVLEWEDITGF
jgi:hypothetical protein